MVDRLGIDLHERSDNSETSMDTFKMILPTSQLIPSYPCAQMQVYKFIASIQRPPLKHGWLAHSSISAKEISYQRFQFALLYTFFSPLVLLFTKLLK